MERRYEIIFIGLSYRLALPDIVPVTPKEDYGTREHKSLMWRRVELGRLELMEKIETVNQMI